MPTLILILAELILLMLLVELVILLLELLKNAQTGKIFSVKVVDINQEMLDVGYQRSVDKNLFSNLEFIN